MRWVVDVDPDHDPTSEYVANVRADLRLLEFLDGLDPDPDLEPTLELSTSAVVTNAKFRKMPSRPPACSI
jgi:hypothetical protein